MRGRARLLAVALAGLAGACAGGPPFDLDLLAQDPPLPFRLGVTGGAFVPRPRPNEAPLPPAGHVLAARTFPPGDLEPIAFDEVCRLLERGRAASEVVRIPLSGAERWNLARARNSQEVQAEIQELGEAHDLDLVLVLEGLRDAPLRSLGVNGQWPLAALGWLLVGLGGFVPDHDFEARVSLSATVHDAHTGRELSRFYLEAAPFSMSMFQRARLTGMLSSILVPPPLVGSEPEKVLAEARRRSRRELLLRLLARLKSRDVLAAIRRRLPFQLELTGLGSGRLRIDVRSRQGLAVLRCTLDGKPYLLPNRGAERFFGSRRLEAGGFSYSLEATGLPERGLLRVLAADVAGRIVSNTVRLETLR